MASAVLGRIMLTEAIPDRKSEPPAAPRQHACRLPGWIIADRPHLTKISSSITALRGEVLTKCSNSASRFAP